MIVVSSAIYEGPYRLSGCCSSLSVVVWWSPVPHEGLYRHSGTRGSWVVCSAMYEGIYAEIQDLMVLFNALKSLGGIMGSWGGL